MTLCNKVNSILVSKAANCNYLYMVTNYVSIITKVIIANYLANTLNMVMVVTFSELTLLYLK